MAIVLFADAGTSRALEIAAPDISLSVPDESPAATPPLPTLAPPPATTGLSSPGAEETPAAPKPAAPRSLDQLVADYASAQTPDAQHECLAGAVYFEAKGEPLRGQLAVAQVVLNRARSGRFPASLCGVVKQRGQFSFIRAGRFPPIARASAAWKRAVAIARIAREDLAPRAAPRALFFHARSVSPGWRLTRVAAVGNHIFYR